ncbi:ABC transporter permease subunit [Paenibacillus sp. LMG 31461]|uniref:ABC transporter permease subunit n=1 Tax=Paenibacillus plantarum TaxID=2654975 RepID=A0ABX1XLZ3_9BACL|nr:carbohydrate ABC transporter permease [Paenibacillus plantarum]NOU68870.1 ABC transporter permease subunit [Paenibacillus plantarum]
MVEQRTWRHSLSLILIHLFLALLALLCILPLVNVLAVSFSSIKAIQSMQVSLWPVEFTIKAYRFVAGNDAFIRSIGVSFERVLLGTAINMLLIVLTSYPLSKEKEQFRFRTGYAWIFVFTMLFSGGLVPTYLVVKQLGLMDSIWALVLPGAVPVFNVILLLNFMRSLPKELMEAGLIDGAGHWTLLRRIVVPLSLPALATVGLFVIVGHWNEWFAGLIYMNNPQHYPLASYLQTVVVRRDYSQMDPTELAILSQLDDRAVHAAQIFLGALPIFCVYPFLQRYFLTGIVMGSVKE